MMLPRQTVIMVEASVTRLSYFLLILVRNFITKVIRRIYNFLSYFKKHTFLN